MTFRYPAVAAAFAVLGFAAENVALAQPLAPAPRPTFSGYGSFFGRGGYYGYGGGGPGYGAYGGFGYGGAGYGFGGPGFGGPGFGGGFGAGGLLQQQNLQIQQQLAATNQNLANLQTFLATGVNPNFPITGRGAVYNNLGHWYPTARSGGGMGMAGGIGGIGAVGGGVVAPRTAGSGLPGGGGAGGAAAPGGAGAAGRTAGTGIPIGGAPQRR